MTKFVSFFVPRLKRCLPGLLGLGWLVAAVAGLGWVWQYETTPGETRAAPATWPVESKIPRATDMPALVLFAHPRCPCTRATLGELAVLMAQSEGHVRAHIVFYHPPGTEEDWTHTDLWDTAAGIPGVTVMDDIGGAEARRFHATVSGQTLLYAADGHRQFAGGITAARGHAGDNAGRATILALLHREAPDGLATPVFGCSLQGHRTLAALAHGSSSSGSDTSSPASSSHE